MDIPENQNPTRRYGRFLRRLLADVDADYPLCAMLVLCPPPEWYSARIAKRRQIYPDWNAYNLDIAFRTAWIDETLRLKAEYINPMRWAIVDAGMELFEMVVPSGLGHDNRYTVVRGTAGQLVTIMEISDIRAVHMWPLQACEMIGPTWHEEDVEERLRLYRDFGAPLDILGHMAS